MKEINFKETPPIHLNTKFLVKRSITKILVIYTGGTIGMVKTKNGYAPCPGYLSKQLLEHSQFMVKSPDLLKEQKQENIFTTPKSQYNKVGKYKILEYKKIIDSSNIKFSDWNKICSDIQKNYHNYDSFLILHGTDTLAFTTSALSFMLQNLCKTVIITGSQIPLSETRNDGIENLLGALQIAIHYDVPEVCLFFNNKLFRGNRCTKSNASGLAAFSSPNFPPLAEFGFNLKINWKLLRMIPLYQRQKQSNNIPDLDVIYINKPYPKISVIRVFPGISEEIIEKMLEAPIEGAILNTYGAGNSPDDKSFLDMLKKYTKKGVIIINVTQCNQGHVSPAYETGLSLMRAGVIPGNDITMEAALTKLIVLVSQKKYFYDNQQIKTLMQNNLKGEMTLTTTVDVFKQISSKEENEKMKNNQKKENIENGEKVEEGDESEYEYESEEEYEEGEYEKKIESDEDEEDDEKNVYEKLNFDNFDHYNQNFLRVLSKICNIQPKQFDLYGLRTSLIPLLIISFVSVGDHKKLKELLKNGIGITTSNVNIPNYDNCCALHFAIRKGNLECAKILLDYGASWTAKDINGLTPIDLILEKDPNSEIFKYFINRIEMITKKKKWKMNNTTIL